MKRIKVSTANIELGMYVSQLDRPWLETPFFFQGFEIREPDDIALLRKFCKHVYVDATKSSVGKKKILEAHNAVDRNVATDPFGHRKPHVIAPRPSLKWRLAAFLARFDPTGVLSARATGQKQYRNIISTRKEAPQAAKAYDRTLTGLNDVLSSVRKGGGVSVDVVRETVSPMIESVMRNQDAMAWLAYLRKRDEYSYNHSIATAVWAVVFGRHLGFDKHGLLTLAMGGLLLDIGKAKIPESIALKSGPLTDEEMKVMRMHVDFGIELAKLTPGIGDDVLDMIRFHHERHDGSGYPGGLSGAEVPVYGRIAGLVDCYDAMITNRSYAPAKSSYDAIRELNMMAGKQFQLEMVEQFVQSMGMFPTGSIVELNGGEIGIVVEQNRVRRLRPRVMLLLDGDKQPLKKTHTVNLRELPSDIDNPKSRWIVQGYEAGAFGIDPENYFL